MKHARTLVALPLVFCSLHALAQDPDKDLIRLPDLVSECESCHGPRGVSDQDDIPSLAGKPADDILDELEKFYFYERHCPTTTYRHGEHESWPELNMCSISSTLSQAEKMALAKHFAAQEKPPAEAD